MNADVPPINKIVTDTPSDEHGKENGWVSKPSAKGSNDNYSDNNY